MSAEIIVFPDAAQIVINWLRPELDDLGHTNIKVASRVPKPRPTKFVTVRRGGGPRQHLVADAAQLLVECWAGNEESAMDLAQDTRALVFAMQGTLHGATPVYRVEEVAGPALLPDPESDQPRVVFTMQVQMRGDAA